jgi:diacylglycerol kinase family enzyme
MPSWSSEATARSTKRSTVVTYLRDLPSLTLRSDGPMGVQADGEYLGRDTVTITSVPDALSVLR